MTIQIRKATIADKEDILRISSQVWDGTDYIPAVLDKWLKSAEGILWVAVLREQVVGFSKMTFLTDSKCWFEGIRVDQASRGMGVGKALTDFQVDESLKRGFKSCGLSSYVDNKESLKMVGSKGFVEMARFKILACEFNRLNLKNDEEKQRESDGAAMRYDYLKDCKVTVLGEDQFEWLVAHMSSSEALKNRGGYLSYDWTFEAFNETLIKERLLAGDFYRLDKQGRYTVFSFSNKHTKGQYRTVNFVSEETLECEVLSYAYKESVQCDEEMFGYMALDNRQQAAFTAIGLEVYNAEDQDVFVFEKKGRV
jgi:ribosomal protein S18 acetylase RimI-like enzyme